MSARARRTGSPAVDQLALAHLVSPGRYDRHLRHLRHLRLRYAARRRALVDALRQHAPDISLSGLAAGFHAVATLPAGSDEHAVVTAAQHRSVDLHGMSRFRCDESPRPARLVLGFGA